MFALDSVLGILGYKVVTDLPSFFAVGGSIAGVTLIIVTIIICVAVKMPLQSVEGVALADLEKAKLTLGTKNTPDTEQVKSDVTIQKLVTIPEKLLEVEDDKEDVEPTNKIIVKIDTKDEDEDEEDEAEDNKREGEE